MSPLLGQAELHQAVQAERHEAESADNTAKRLVVNDAAAYESKLVMGHGQLHAEQQLTQIQRGELEQEKAKLRLFYQQFESENAGVLADVDNGQHVLDALQQALDAETASLQQLLHDMEAKHTSHQPAALAAPAAAHPPPSAAAKLGSKHK